jgi:hypothetical protein
MAARGAADTFYRMSHTEFFGHGVQEILAKKKQGES